MPLDLNLAVGPTIAILLAVATVACVDLVHRMRHQSTHLFFACALGTLLSFALIWIGQSVFDGAPSPFLMAALIVMIVVVWRSLFGPWEVMTKATVLTTFLFWIALRVIGQQTGEEQLIRLIAAIIALIPAVAWVFLFLKYHAERPANVLLVFAAGMLATAPILFYDALARRGTELHFFLFTVTPESFHRTTQEFLTDYAPLESGVQMTFATALLTFGFVALLEEVSKYWVLTRSARPFLHSIDDAMQLSIVAAIGFAFAENVVNPVYFTAFVRDYLLHGSAPDMGSFLGNVLGRSVLTTMVHVFSTGVMGYFLGLALFAGPYLQERHKQGHAYRLTRWIHNLLRVPEESIFRLNMLTTGMILAIVLHALFNVLVTLPEILPGNPDTLGELIGANAPAFLDRVPLLLIPSMFYVVGGFWVLTTLFLRTENMQERGQLQSGPVPAANVA